MKVTVVIGTYNDENHIGKTIDSVLKQTYPDWECIIVDNGSTDNTFSTAQSLISNENKFKVFKKDNKGPSSSRNFSLTQIKNDCTYVHFLDGDDFLDASFLTTMVAYMNDNPNVGLLGCQFNIVNTESKFVKKGLRSRYAPNKFGLPKRLKSQEFYTPFESFFSSTGQGPFALFRLKILKKTTGYEESFWSHEDSDIFCQMALYSEVHYLPERLYNKRVHDNNLTYSPRASYKKFREKWDFYISDNRSINIKIDKAIKYYHCFHAPLRTLQISKKALGEFLQNGMLSSLKWSLICFKNGLTQLLFRKNYKHIMNKRKSIINATKQS